MFATVRLCSLSFFAIFLLDLHRCELISFNPEYRYKYKYSVTQSSNEPHTNELILYSTFEILPKSKSEYDLQITEASVLGSDKQLKLFEELKKRITVVRNSSGSGLETQITFHDRSESIPSRNIKRGIVNLLDVEYRKDENFYTANQHGINGYCNNGYVLDRKRIPDEESTAYLIRSQLPGSCASKNQFYDLYTGIKLRCWQKFDVKSSQEYFYSLNENENDVTIVRADSKQIISLAYFVYKNLTKPLISVQKLQFVEKAPKQASSRFIRSLGLPSLPNVRIPPINIDNVVDNAKETADKARETLETVIGKSSELVTDLEAERMPFHFAQRGNQVAVRQFNHLLQILDTNVKSEDIEKLHIISEYGELISEFRSKNSESLIEIYNSPEIKANLARKTKLFFQILSAVPTYDAFEAMAKITKSHSGTSEYSSTLEQAALYFTSRTTNYVYLTRKMAEEHLKFCDSSDMKLFRKACFLYVSRMFHDLHAYDITQTDVEQLFEHIKQWFPPVEQVEKVPREDVLLAIKVAKNFGLLSGYNYIRSILLKKDLNALVRIEAAWALIRFGSNFPEHNSTIFSVLYDKDEDHEIRYAAFVAGLYYYKRDMLPIVLKLRNNFLKDTFEDDKQFVLQAISALKAFSKLKENECQKDFIRDVKYLLDHVRSDFRKYLGSGSMLNSRYEIKESHDGCKRTTFGVLNSETSIFPRTISFEFGDIFSFSGYYLRSFHDNFLTDFIPSKLSTEPDHKIQDTMLRIIEQLHLKRKQPVESSFIISHVLNFDEIYFIYGDEETHFNAQELIEFTGNGLESSGFIYLKSVTSAGLPFVFLSNQLTLTDYTFHDSGINALTATTGISSISAFVDEVSNLKIHFGKLSEKIMRLNTKIQLENNAKSFGNFSLKGSVSLLGENGRSKTVFYESQKIFNYLISEQSNFLPLNRLANLSSDEYEETVYDYCKSLVVNSKQPYGKRDQNKLSLKRMFKGWGASDVLISTRPYNYEIKLSIEPDAVNRPFTFEIDGRGNQQAYRLDLAVAFDQNPLHRIIIERSVSEADREIEYAIKSKHYEAKVNSLFTAKIEYPKETSGELKFAVLIRNTANATLTGKFFKSNDMNKDILGSDEEDLKLAFQGSYSKRVGQKELVDVINRARVCSNRRDINCLSELYSDAYKYNSLMLNVKFKEQTSGESEPTIIDKLEEKMLSKFGSYAEYSLEPKTKKGEALIRIDLHDELKKQNLVDMSISDHSGETKFSNMPARFAPYLFGYSYFDLNLELKEKFPILKAPKCYVHGDEFITFDGYRRINSTSGACRRSFVVAADCKHFKFFVVKNENSVNVYYGHKYNVTFTNEDVFINGHVLSAKSGVYQNYENMRISLIVSYYNGRIYVEADHYYKGNLCGVCGNYDDDWSNDIVSPQRERIKVNEFHEAWSYGEAK
ncbi:Vitellogenin-1-like protein, partial [Dinothrombium tinctorium]